MMPAWRRQNFQSCARTVHSSVVIFSTLIHRSSTATFRGFMGLEIIPMTGSHSSIFFLDRLVECIWFRIHPKALNAFMYRTKSPSSTLLGPVVATHTRNLSRVINIFTSSWVCFCFCVLDAVYQGLSYFNGHLTRKWSNVYPFFIQGEVIHLDRAHTASERFPRRIHSRRNFDTK